VIKLSLNEKQSILDIDMFPQELSLAINGLNNAKRQKIIMKLYSVQKMSFSEIREITGINDSLLSNHLRKLKDSMLIEQFYEHLVGQENYSFYKITKYGKKIINNLFNIFYVVHKRKVQLYLKIEEETAIPSEALLSSRNPTSELSDTAEEIKQILDKLVWR